MHPNLVNSITSAHISPDALLQHFDQGQVELNNKQYQASSHHFTAAIDEATNSLSTLLLSRALAYTNDGQHDRALADACKVREITPASADGYLCAGDIHVIMGNKEKALQIYRNGVANASKEHPRYHSLEEYLQHLYHNVILPINGHLMQRLDKRIVNHIFSLLPLRDRVVCAATCHTWRTYLFSWEGMWRHLRFTSGISSQCLDSLFMQMKNHGDQVKTCTIAAKWEDFDLAPRILEHLVLGLKCRNLEALSVGNCNVKTTQWIIRLLRMNIKTIKSLALIKVAQQLYPVIHQVLDLCPGITSLVFNLHEHVDARVKAPDVDYVSEKVIPSSEWRPRAPLALQKLKLTTNIFQRNKEGVFTFAHLLSTLLPHCHELSNLVVRGSMTQCLDSVIDALNAYCPNLKGLDLNADAFSEPFPPLSVLAISTTFLQQNGLCDDYGQNLAALTMRIAPHIQYLRLDITSHTQMILKALAEVKAPKLEDLKLTLCHTARKDTIDQVHCNELVRAVIEGCSMTRLKNVTLHGLPIDDSVLESLPSALTSLDLSIENSNVTSQGLERCLSKMYELKKLSLVDEIPFEEEQAVSIIQYELLHVIAQLPSIIELNLSFDPDNNNDQQRIVSRFAKELRSFHPQLPLRKLTLDAPIIHEPSTLGDLVCLPNLEYLYVRMDYGIKAEQVKEVLHNTTMNDTVKALIVKVTIHVDDMIDTITFKNGEIVSQKD
ncbi:hypothetical protein LRAMOSA04009 [Lichtheimia ramosa]|uniref:F-box domain-containing protein n=1 Tax=Lichtheimia ramosa TaxID=688394 RepID=A0A077WVT9_9FUNG|nr:hypothetical protein LRAMOSA04009 [Lichtheimia ramosa]